MRTYARWVDDLPPRTYVRVITDEWEFNSNVTFGLVWMRLHYRRIPGEVGRVPVLTHWEQFQVCVVSGEANDYLVSAGSSHHGPEIKIECSDGRALEKIRDQIVEDFLSEEMGYRPGRKEHANQDGWNAQNLPEAVLRHGIGEPMNEK